MTELRRLNEAGVDAFGRFITDARRDPTTTPPVDLLTDAAYSEAVVGGATVEARHLTTKLEAAQVLVDLLDRSDLDVRQRFDPARADNEGLWSWLSLRFFDSLCPPDGSGRRRIRASAHYRYVADYAPFRANRAYRHLLVGPYRILRRHGPELSAGLLAGAASDYHDHYEQVASRNSLWTDEGFLRLFYEIYFSDDRTRWDARAGTGRREGPGSIRRLSDVFQQFALTYDVRGMNADALRALLPTEFHFQKTFGKAGRRARVGP